MLKQKHIEKNREKEKTEKKIITEIKSNIIFTLFVIFDWHLLSG